METKEAKLVAYLNKLRILPREVTFENLLKDEYALFKMQLFELDDLVERLPTPRRILQLSVGAGVYGLWFAQEYPEAEVVVVGSNPDFMQCGKDLARHLGINNIAFLAHTNDDWAALAEGDFDVVISHRAIDTSGVVAPRTHKFAESYRASLEVDARVTSAVNAIANSLTPDGVALVTMKFNPKWEAVHLFEAIRNAGLGVDWLGSCEFRRFLWDYRSHCLFVRKGIPHLFSNGLDDAICFQTIWEAWSDASETFEFSGLAADLIIATTSDGELLYQVKGITSDGIELLESGSVWHGLCLETRTATDGDQSHRNVVPADILKNYWQRKTGKLTHDGKELANVEITVTPRFQRLLDYYGSKGSEDE